MKSQEGEGFLYFVCFAIDFSMSFFFGFLSPTWSPLSELQQELDNISEYMNLMNSELETVKAENICLAAKNKNLA